MTGRRVTTAAVLLAALLPGCTGADDAPTAVDAPAAVRRTAAQDGTTLDVTLDRDEAGTGEPLVLTIDVAAPPGTDVRMPAWTDTLGPFEIVDATRPPDVPDGAVRRWTHRYTLTTFNAGTHEIPEIAVGLAREDAAGDPGAVGLAGVSTAAIPVEIISALAGLDDATDVLALHDAVAVPVAPPPAWPWFLVVAVAYYVAAVVALLVIAVRTGRALRVVLPPAPDEWAHAELDRLAAEDLPARGAFLPFYVRLSDIVRRYVEARFRISAPEQTTDEFLRAARRHEQLDDEHRTLLAGFLRAADMVKFAKHEPGRTECDDALAAARSFVEATGEAAPAREFAA